MNARSSATSKALPALPILDSILGSRSTLVVSDRKASLTASRISPVCAAVTILELAESGRPVKALTTTPVSSTISGGLNGAGSNPRADGALLCGAPTP